MADVENGPDGKRPDDRRPGRLPLILSARGNLIWCCRVYSQPADVRLVLRASADGHVWASIGTVDSSVPGAVLRDIPSARKKRPDRSNG